MSEASRNQSWAGEEELTATLALLTNRRPIAAEKVKNAAKTALKFAHEYKMVVYTVESFIRKAVNDDKLPGLCVLDAICKHPKSQQFRDRFSQRIRDTAMHVAEHVSSKDKSTLVKILEDWEGKNLFEKPDISFTKTLQFLSSRSSSSSGHHHHHQHSAAKTEESQQQQVPPAQTKLNYSISSIPAPLPAPIQPVPGILPTYSQQQQQPVATDPRDPRKRSRAAAEPMLTPSSIFDSLPPMRDVDRLLSSITSINNNNNSSSGGAGGGGGRGSSASTSTGSRGGGGGGERQQRDHRQASSSSSSTQSNGGTTNTAAAAAAASAPYTIQAQKSDPRKRMCPFSDNCVFGDKCRFSHADTPSFQPSYSFAPRSSWGLEALTEVSLPVAALKMKAK